MLTKMYSNITTYMYTHVMKYVKTTGIHSIYLHKEIFDMGTLK